MKKKIEERIKGRVLSAVGRGVFFLLYLLQPYHLLAQGTGNLIADYLRQEQAKNQWLASDIDDWQQTDAYTDAATGISHIYMKQRFHHIPVYNAISAFAIKEGQLAHASLALTPHLAGKVNSEHPAMSARDAIDYALQHVIGKVATYAGLTDLDAEQQAYYFEVPEFSNRDVYVQLVWQPYKNQVRLAWNVSIEMKQGSDWWNIRVDAQDGEVIGQDNYTVACGAEYTVYPFPLEAPSFGSRSLLCDPADANASPFGWHDVNGIAGAEYSITRGNNVYAYEDMNNDNLPGYSPNSAGLQFNYPVNFNLTPAANQDAAITNLFYVNNRLHDYLYYHGFTEAAGNFQQTNYSNAGAGNDYVKAEALDGGGTNNANFSTPPDGSSGRMQMYTWNVSCSSLNIASAGFNGPLSINTASFSALASVTANLILVNDGSGVVTDACQTVVNNIAGKIALIDRGTCNFITKAQTAQAAGAVGVIIANNQAGGAPSMSGTPTLSIPVISVSQSDGNLLKSLLSAGTVSATINTCAYAVDGSFDNGIVAHEYGHGVSNRLTGGPSNTSCLSNAEQGGEGWSDWLALMMTIRPSDIGPGFLNSSRGIGTYALGQPTTGAGIRHYPYSTNMSINPLTYAFLGGALIGTEVHAIGEVWCAALWDMSSFLINDLGFNSDPSVSGSGNAIAMRLVLEGMKLQPCSPGFLDARDAILSADAILYNNAHRCRIWEAFARRGMGIDAVQGSSNNAADQTAGFAMPYFCSAPTQVPVAGFSSNFSSIPCTGSVQFTDASTQAFTWNWSFGDGTTSILQHPSHTFSSPGSYPVKLVVSNPLGSDSVTHVITVSSPFSVNVSATPNPVCSGSPVQLNATASGSTFIQYTVSSIPYAPLSGTLVPVSLADDAVSAALPIGFTFTFFGQSYTSFYMCSNGFITFSPGQSATPVYGPSIPSAIAPNNLIALAWNDLNPQNAGSSLGYFLTGTAPNRKLVIQYTTSHYGGVGYPFEVQAILSEGSQAIEIHTTTISDATAYDPDATTTQGIENATGSYGVAVPGRNGSFFTASHDAYRFTPFTGYSYQWTPGNLLGATQTVTASPTSNYTVQVSDGSGCIVKANAPALVVNTAPSFTSCPSTQWANTPANGCSQPVVYAQPLISSGSPAPSLTYSLSGATNGNGNGDANGSLFNRGTTHVKVYAMNACAIDSCGFDVVVTDNTPPVVICPATITSTQHVVNYSVSASDACSTPVLSYSMAPGSYFPCGTTTVTVTATDASANTQSCTFNVVVNAPVSTVLPVTACDSYTWAANGTTYSLSGIYSRSYTTTSGCDSTVFLDLQLGHSNASTVSASNKGCYTWPANGVTYSVSGVYTYTAMNAQGCDSILTLNLTITPGIYVHARVILSGAYDANLGLMHDSLRARGLLPLTEPYSLSPFNKTPIGGPGGETVSAGVLAQTGTEAIVDWVFLELRDAINTSNVVANKRALLRRDGIIVSTDGLSPVEFATLPNGNYYVSVKHRNHLGVMTQESVSLNGCGSSLVDLSDATPVFTNAQVLNTPRKSIGLVNALWAGDANFNKNVRYNGTSNDKESVLQVVGSSTPNSVLNNVYRAEDVNLDGKIRYNGTDNDRTFILGNVGVNTPNMILFQHTPN